MAPATNPSKVSLTPNSAFKGSNNTPMMLRSTVLVIWIKSMISKANPAEPSIRLRAGSVGELTFSMECRPRS